MQNIRPSWPPPSRPSHAPGGIVAGAAITTRAEPASRAPVFVCFCRKAASFRASAGSPVASIATANSPAFAAPASPMAKVATGMPLGIWTIDSSESSPRRYFDGTGTPSTGTVVLAASMPGRCAAPPAPAMIARSPRGSASSAYSNMSSGIRCADRTRVSNGTPKASSCAAACFITSQSLSLPMTTPTCGDLFRCAIGPPRCRPARVRRRLASVTILARRPRTRGADGRSQRDLFAR